MDGVSSHAITKLSLNKFQLNGFKWIIEMMKLRLLELKGRIIS